MLPLTLDSLAPLMDRVHQWVIQAYPNEGCGLIVERDGRLEAICCENEQDRLHALDSSRYPNTARTAYAVDPIRLMESQSNGFALRAVFHSHPDRGAYFSSQDVLGALGGDPTGEPVFPGVDYWVLGTRSTGVEDARLFGWSSERRRFEERS